MSAPESVYTGALDSPSTAETKVVRLTSSSETSSVLKDRFYLDAFLDPTSLGITGMWAGGCRVGSPNYYMHNISRIGWPTLWKDGFEYVIFWDAGLNTLGKVLDRPQLVSPVMTSMTVKATYKSAWYLESRCQMEYRMMNDTGTQWGAWQRFGDEFNLQQQGVSEFSFSKGFTNITRAMRVYGIDFRGVLHNDEGSYLIAEIGNYKAEGIPNIFVNPERTLWSSSSELIYDSDNFSYASVLFTDKYLEDELDNPGTVNLYLDYTGTYRRWIVYGYSNRLGYSCALSLEQWSDPNPQPIPTYEYKGYDMYSQQDSEDMALSGGVSTEVLYIDNSDINNSKVYHNITLESPNWVFKDLAEEGYYSMGDRNVGITRVMRVFSNGTFTYVEPLNN